MLVGLIIVGIILIGLCIYLFFRNPNRLGGEGNNIIMEYYKNKKGEYVFFYARRYPDSRVRGQFLCNISRGKENYNIFISRGSTWFEDLSVYEHAEEDKDYFARRYY